jgi:hypothetical protein
MTRFLLLFLPLLTLSACGAGGEVGDECEVDDDCADGLECHLHDGEDHGECEDHEHEEE